MFAGLVTALAITTGAGLRGSGLTDACAPTNTGAPTPLLAGLFALLAIVADTVSGASLVTGGGALAGTPPGAIVFAGLATLLAIVAGAGLRGSGLAKGRGATGTVSPSGAIGFTGLFAALTIAAGARLCGSWRTDVASCGALPLDTFLPLRAVLVGGTRRCTRWIQKTGPLDVIGMKRAFSLSAIADNPIHCGLFDRAILQPQQMPSKHGGQTLKIFLPHNSL